MDDEDAMCDTYNTIRHNLINGIYQARKKREAEDDEEEEEKKCQIISWRAKLICDFVICI